MLGTIAEVPGVQADKDQEVELEILQGVPYTPGGVSGRDDR
jgi:hypothetical protein